MMGTSQSVVNTRSIEYQVPVTQDDMTVGIKLKHKRTRRRGLGSSADKSKAKKGIRSFSVEPPRTLQALNRKKDALRQKRQTVALHRATHK